jgi:hypothetical protein
MPSNHVNFLPTSLPIFPKNLNSPTLNLPPTNKSLFYLFIFFSHLHLQFSTFFHEASPFEMTQLILDLLHSLFMISLSLFPLFGNLLKLFSFCFKLLHVFDCQCSEDFGRWLLTVLSFASRESCSSQKPSKPALKSSSNPP